MREREIITQTLNATDVRANWAEVVNDVSRKKTRVVVEKSGVPVAAIVSPDDLERLRELDAQRGRDFAVLDRVRSAFRDVPPEEFEREVARAIEEVRAENRRARAAAANAEASGEE